MSIMPEEEWRNKVVENVQVAVAAKPHSTLPIPAAFARNVNFWKAFALSAVLGAILGLATLGFMNLIVMVRLLR